jgi:hypothetical protein
MRKYTGLKAVTPMFYSVVAIATSQSENSLLGIFHTNARRD